MNWADRIFISVLVVVLLAFGYFIFFDQQKKNHNIQRINKKLLDIQDIAKDLKKFSKILNTKNAIANIQFDANPDIFLMEKTYKMSLVADVIEAKADMMDEAIKDALKELQLNPTFCETL